MKSTKPYTLTNCKYCGCQLTDVNARTFAADKKGYRKRAGWCLYCDEPTNRPCATPGCPYTRIHYRSVCAFCHSQQVNEAAKRRRGSHNRKAGTTFRCNEGCRYWRDCTTERLWAKADPLPCESLLDDEIGCEYEGGELSVWIMPLKAVMRVGVVG